MLGENDEQEEVTAIARRSERRAWRLSCLSLGFGNDRQGRSRSRDVSLTILAASMSGCKSVTLRLSPTASFTSADHKAWSLRLTCPKRTKNSAAFYAAEKKERKEK